MKLAHKISEEIECNDNDLLSPIISTIDTLFVHKVFHTPLLAFLFNDSFHLKKGDFSGFTSLVYLYMDESDLLSIEPGAFSEAPSLKSLHLQHNKLETLQKNTFSGADSLVSINLENNKLASIEPGAFSGADSLEDLYLQHNKLETLQKNTFNDLPSIRNIYLFGNPILAKPSQYIWLRELPVRFSE